VSGRSSRGKTFFLSFCSPFCLSVCLSVSSPSLYHDHAYPVTCPHPTINIYLFPYIVCLSVHILFLLPCQYRHCLFLRQGFSLLLFPPVYPDHELITLTIKTPNLNVVFTGVSHSVSTSYRTYKIAGPPR
jgi:hypothetical protein